MDEETKPASGSGKIHYQLQCAYHSDLGDYDTNEAAIEAAFEHMKTRHADSNGRVAESAEVLITPVTHVTVADMKEHDKQKRAEKQ